MKSYTHRIDLASTIAAADSQQIQSLLTCQPLNVKSLNVSLLVLGKSIDLPAPPSTDDQFYILLSGSAQVSISGHNELEQAKLITESGTTVYQPPKTQLHLTGHSVAPSLVLQTSLNGKQNRPNSSSPDAAICIPSTVEFKLFSPGEERGSIVDAPTPSLRRLHSFFLTLDPGAVVPRHQHRDHGVLIVFLEGEIDIQGQTIAAPAFLYYRGGEPHGFHCTETGTVKAVAIEFYQEPPLLENLRSGLRESPVGAIGRTMKAKLFQS